jgi:uncharacterized phage infection (PIP) family protein YhgE
LSSIFDSSQSSKESESSSASLSTEFFPEQESSVLGDQLKERLNSPVMVPTVSTINVQGSRSLAKGNERDVKIQRNQQPAAPATTVLLPEHKVQKTRFTKDFTRQDKRTRRLNGIDVVHRLVKDQITKETHRGSTTHENALSAFSTSVEERFQKLAIIMDEYRQLLTKSKKFKSNADNLTMRLERIRKQRDKIQEKLSIAQKSENNEYALNRQSKEDQLAIQIGSLSGAFKSQGADG